VRLAEAAVVGHLAVGLFAVVDEHVDGGDDDRAASDQGLEPILWNRFGRNLRKEPNLVKKFVIMTLHTYIYVWI
jgi:hypothetical protein